MKKIIKFLLNRVRPSYDMVYRKKDGVTKMYRIKKPSLDDEFDNKKEGETSIGVRAWCYNRKGVRSFRYDGIISLTKN
jgi:hypothetical protein